MDRIRQQPVNMTALYSACMFLLLLLLSLSLHTHADSMHNIVIITSSDSKYQQKTASRIREKLEAGEARTVIVSADDIASTSQNGRTLYVAIGEMAINNLHEFDRNAMVLRLAGKNTAGRKYTSTQSDLVITQPDCRHIQLIKAINREWSSVAVLASVDSLDTAAALTKCAIRHDLNLRVYAITDKSDLLATLEAAVEDNHALLAIIDPLIYNSRTVKNILLTAYRHRKPVIGYSDSFVQAGAVAAVYTSPETVGDHAAKIVMDYFENNWQFGKNIYYIDEFSISTNSQVATALEINLPDGKSIRESIISLESQP